MNMNKAVYALSFCVILLLGYIIFLEINDMAFKEPNQEVREQQAFERGWLEGYISAENNIMDIMLNECRIDSSLIPRRLADMVWRYDR